MLTEAEIKTLGLIVLDTSGTPAPDSCYDITSYNLRLGAEFALIDGDGAPRDCSTGLRQLRIPPFGCALVSSREVVRLPMDIYGRWGLKIKPSLAGLVFQAGPQIEPGSYTRLFGLLFNLSSTERVIPFEQPMWSIDFEQIPAPIPNSSAQGSPRLNLRDYTATQWGVPQGSLQELYADYQRLQSANSTRREGLFAVLLVLVVFLASTVVPVVAALRDDGPSPAELQRRITELEQNQSLRPQPSAKP